MRRLLTSGLAAAGMLVLAAPAQATLVTGGLYVDSGNGQSAGSVPDGVCVEVYDANAAPDSPPVATTTTGNPGTGGFKVDLPDGSYKFGYAVCPGAPNDQFVPEYEIDKPTRGEANVVNVPAQQAGLGGGLLPASAVGGISGRVTDSGGNPVPGICVATANNINKRATTAADGTYRIARIDPGQHSVVFTTSGCPEATAAAIRTEYYSNEASQADAELISVAGGQTTPGINAIVGPPGADIGGVITGIVRDEGGPRPGVCAHAVDPASGAVESTNVTGGPNAQGGHFRISGLDSRSYALSFGTDGCSQAFGAPTITEFFDGAGSLGGATPVATVEGSVTDIGDSVTVQRVPVPAGTTTEIVQPGGNVSSDADGSGPTEGEPVTTAVTSPNGGQVTIVDEAGSSGKPPKGFSLLKHSVEITAPDATVQNPLRITFVLDASLLDGADPATIVPVRDGKAAGECPGKSTATPDPCVTSRQMSAGDLELVVLTSHASLWGFAEPNCLVPKLVGKSLGKAKKALKNAHCKLGKAAKKASGQKKGVVIAQSLKPKTEKPAGAKVNVTVSKG